MNEFLEPETNSWAEQCGGQMSEEDGGNRINNTGHVLPGSSNSDEKKEDFFFERVPPLSTPEPSLR